VTASVARHYDVAVVGAGPVGAVLDSALRRAVDAILRRQSASGEWEGEVAWGPMLAAQYVLMCQTTGSAIPAARGEMPAAERVPRSM
jgi:cation diffusion facilitator CzcD-associated flavoprotein CzcO